MVATFRSAYGCSAWGIGLSVSWAEACDLVDAALGDTGTALFAAAAGWEWPTTMPEMLTVAAAYGRDYARVMPFSSGDKVSAAEIEQAHDELLSEIRFGK